MDLTHFIQETDHAATYDTPVATGCAEMEEFQSLSHLAYEFSVLDRSLFPFRVLGDSDLRTEIYGFPGRPIWGNYVAGYILRELRIESRKNTQIHLELWFISDLPPDLVFEIFEHLHPIDLYNLIRTSKAFRSLLLGRQATAVWREAFRRHPDIPSCPPDVSLPKWVSLLFGPPTCDDCGSAKDVPDFLFRNRKCNDCMATAFDRSDNFQHFEGEHASQRKILFKLVKRTHRFDATSYPIDEVNSRAAEMKQFLVAIDSDQPNAQEAYDIFKAETARAVDAMMKHVQVCNAWWSNFSRLLHIEFSDTIPHTLKRFQKRLVKIGYNPKDVEEAWRGIYWIISENSVRNFNKAFRSFFPILKKILREAQYTRRVREQEELISQRKQEVVAIYKDCQRSLDPALWQYFPDPDYSYGMDTISHYIHSHEQSAILDPHDTTQMILLFFDQWLACGKRGLLELMLKHHTPSVLQDNALDLATSVFICTSHSPIEAYPVLLGWEDAAVHLECNMSRNHEDLTKNSPELFLFEYSMTGHTTVLFLLGLLGLEGSMSAPDVEALEARFMCASCPLEDSQGGMKGRFAFTFKECVSHVVSRPHHPTDSFLLLSKEATESVLFHESSSSPGGEPSWCCKHCSSQFESYVSRKSVIYHLREMHSISEPIQRVDFLHQRQKIPPHRTPYLADITRTYRCKNCPSPRLPRLWQMQALFGHLKDKHDVSEPVQNVDWHEIGLLQSN